MNCPICDSAAIDRLYRRNLPSARPGKYLIAEDVSGQCHDLFQCRACRHAFVRDKIYIAAVTRGYRHQPLDRTYLDEAEGRRKAAQRCLTRLEKHSGRPGKILDIGCYAGLLLETAQKRGWTVAGIEDSRQAVRYAGDNMPGGTIIGGRAEDVLQELTPEQYDGVTLVDVIEHLEDPVAVMERLHPRLAPQGRLLISTPDITSIMARLQKQKWYAVLPSHIHLFSRQSLFLLLERTGFTVVESGWQTRYFSARYMLQRSYLSHRPVFRKFMNFPICSRLVLPYNVRDQQVVIARKAGA